MDWPTAISDIAKIAIPSIVTAVVTYKVAKFQITTKELELRSQAELKAKEMLLGVYQKRIERITQGSKDFAEQIHKILPELKEIEKNQGAEAAAIPILIIVKTAFNVWKDDFSELVKELESLDLHVKWKNQIEHLNTFFSINRDEITVANINLVYIGFMDAVGTISLLYNESLHKKSEQLFLGQLKTASSRRS